MTASVKQPQEGEHKIRWYAGYRRSDEGSFAVITARGDIRLSHDLSRAAPAGKRYCRIGFLPDPPALVIAMEERNTSGCLRVSSRQGKSLRIGSRRALHSLIGDPPRGVIIAAAWDGDRLYLPLPEPSAVRPETPAPSSKGPRRVRCPECHLLVPATHPRGRPVPAPHKAPDGVPCRGLRP